MKQTNSRTIKADKNSHFLSDERKFLPANCLFNKGITGCGGTTLEIDCPRNSLILVPNINLVLDKCASHPSLIGVYGDISNTEISSKLQEQLGYHKIIATYDALPRIIECVGPTIYNYFLLIDEYHILFNSYSFRYGPIKFILDNYSKFNKFCFMTATPLEEFNILEEIKDLPRITMEWPQAIKMSISVKNAFFTSKEVLKEILLSKNNN